MRSSPGWATLASLLLACSLFACYDGAAQGGTSRVTSSPWCNAMCSAYQRCEGSVSPSCSSDCKAATPSFFARTSTASLEAQAECMLAASCTPDFEGLIDECYEASFFELEPSAEAIALCAEMATPFFECGWFSTPQSCGKFHAAFSAPALAAEQECAAASCLELDGCIEAQLYSFGE